VTSDKHYSNNKLNLTTGYVQVISWLVTFPYKHMGFSDYIGIKIVGFNKKMTDKIKVILPYLQRFFSFGKFVVRNIPYKKYYKFPLCA